MARSAGELLDALAAGALDVVQPDVVLAAGMLRARTVAEVAMLGHCWFTPHTWTNGLGLLANLHVAAGVGGGPYLEFPYDPPGWTPQRRDFFLARPLDIDPEGWLTVPDRPGLGAEIDEAAVTRWARH
jgi:D-galactarolactone cycloisomerase